MRFSERDVFGMILVSLFSEYCIEFWVFYDKGKVNVDGDFNEEL